MYFYKLKLYWVHIWFMLLYTNKLRKVIMGVADESTYNSLSKKLHKHHRLHLHMTAWPMKSLERVIKFAFLRRVVGMSEYPGAVWNLMVLCRDSLSPHQSHSEYIAPRVDYCWAADVLKPYVQGDSEDIEQMQQDLVCKLWKTFAEEPPGFTQVQDISPVRQ